jgi:hypothetical protein
MPDFDAKSIYHIDMRSYRIFNTDVDMYKTIYDDLPDNFVSKSLSCTNRNSIRYESYMYKFDQNGNGLKRNKYWVVLVNYDLFFFKSKEKLKIKKFHQISDSFVNEKSFQELLIITSRYFIIKRKRIYFTQNHKKRRNLW